MLTPALWSLESGPLKVLRVIDGDSIIVEGHAGGVAVPISIRLKYIDTPEMRDGKKDNPHGLTAKNGLSKILKKGSRVSLYTSRRSFSADMHGRLLAIVFLIKKNGDKLCLQEYMIATGMTVYWQRFGNASSRFHKQWIAREKTAELHAAGLWLRQRSWMLEKRSE